MENRPGGDAAATVMVRSSRKQHGRCNPPLGDRCVEIETSHVWALLVISDTSGQDAQNWWFCETGMESPKLIPTSL